MKITVLSDIHGNIHALEAVLHHARGQGASQVIINLGDSVGYGPDPNGVIRSIRGENFLNIIGNYDQKVISNKHQQEGWKSVKTPDKRAMFNWTYKALSKPSIKFLRELPEQRTLLLAGLQVMLSHGSPESIIEHLRPDTPATRFSELAKHFNADVILCGHSHQAFVRHIAGVLFVNPGSVGRPDDGDPRASYAVLTIEDEKAKAETFRVPYHVSGAVQAMRRTGLPQIFAEVLRQGKNYNDVRALNKDKPTASSLDPCGTLTLLTDFGLQDHFVGVMKGVINEISPQTSVIDISHQIRPQNVKQAAQMLLESSPYFAPGTVHIAVVDPGVGTTRRALAAQVGSQFFVVPDNGLLWPMLEKARRESLPIKIVNLDKPEYWLPKPSASFHGRDIFSPVGAHLANGIPLESLGTVIDDPIPLDLPKPKRIANGWQGEVVMVDVFGNLNTNIPASAIPNIHNVARVEIGETSIEGLTHTFGDADPGTLIATIDSTGSLGISVVNGNAAEKLDADIGTSVRVILSS